MTQDQALYYLAAMIDGEGCVSFSESNGQREIIISNTEKSIVKKTEECLDLLEIDCGIYLDPTNGGGGRKPIFILVIGGQKNLEFIYEVVPLGSEAKSAKLTTLVNSYKLSTPRPRQPRSARPVGW